MVSLAVGFAFVVAGVTAVTDNPDECEVDDSVFLQHDEVRSMRRSQKRSEHPCRQTVAAEGTVGKAGFECTCIGSEPHPQVTSSIVILSVCRVSHECPHQAERIDRKVPFAAGNVLARVVSSFYTSLGRATGLAVDDRHGGSSALADAPADSSPQRIVNPHPQTADPPASKQCLEFRPSAT